MAGDDDDKTVFGGKLPDPTPAPARNVPPPVAPTPRPALGGAPDERTVIGGALPPQSPPASAPGTDERTIVGGALPTPPPNARPAPAPPPQTFAPPPPAAGAGIGQPQSESGQTWLGGALPQNTPPPQQPSYAPQPFGQPQPGYVPPASGAGIGEAPGASGQGFFPDMPGQHQGQQPHQHPMSSPRISLDQALRAAGLGAGGSTNPLVAAAANLLILFGRLRTGLVEMQAGPLMDHVTREIDTFERNAVAAGVDPHEALVAKYALCGAADDIVQNLPGADRGMWIQYSMVARFFQKRDSGVGFFQEAEKAMQAPGQRYNLLELMLVCLNLGFEGQYRTLPNGASDLSRIRSAIYETLRRVQPRPDEDISVTWWPVLLGGRRRFGGVPVWGVFGIAAAVLVAFFATLSTLINRDGSDVSELLYAMHPTEFGVTLERTPGPVFVATSTITQLQRIQDGLASEISNGLVTVGQQGEFIYVRVGNKLLFASGSSTVNSAFVPLASRVTEVLNSEPGAITVIGFTDSRGSFNTNARLSVARAEAVATVLRTTLEDPSRLTVEGRGETEPIGDNNTEEGRALNRRVDVKIAREGTF
ncbi:MAG: type IVB secretion system protein IcmH/DotU [Aliishimia sp.]